MKKRGAENEVNDPVYYESADDSLEVDSDVNEDPNREALLDRSMRDFYESAAQRIHEKEGITNVPGSSAFDAATEIEDRAE